MVYKGKYFCVEGRNGRKHGKESFGPAEAHFLNDEEITTQELKEQKHKNKARLKQGLFCYVIYSRN